MADLSGIRHIAEDFIAHRVSAAYFARHVSEALHKLAADTDNSRKNHGAMIVIAQALFFMGVE